MTTSSVLFEPGKIGNLEVKNRLVMGSMGNSYASEDGYMTGRLIDYYIERAKGGVGLIVTQPINITARWNFPNRPSLHDDRFVERMRALPDAVHRYDTKICAQLLGRTGITGLPTSQAQGRPAFIPSYLPSQGHGEGFRDASILDIAQIVNEFAEAARRAKEAGFDAVEFHACHGAFCVISSFMSPFTNRRTDQYGGTVENRTKLACEILAKTREKVGIEFPLVLRINGSDGMEGGKTIEEAIAQAVILEKAGINAISVSSGAEPWTSWMSFPMYLVQPGISVSCAEAIKKEVKIPVMCAGKIDSSLAEKLIKHRKVDFVVLGRPLLADPHLPNKLREGRLEEIVKCLYCNNCMERFRRCSVNPYLLNEREAYFRPSALSKKVIVAGGGIAGMQAAKILAERGHQVSLYERTGELGGQLNIAALQTDKAHFAGFTRYLSRCIQKAGVDVRLNEELTALIVEERQPDVVIVATGAKPKTLPVLGSDGKNVIQANDLITGKANTGGEVVVIGGRALGMEIALSLAQEGKKVSLITRRKLGRDMEFTLFSILKNKLLQHRVPVYQDALVAEIKPNGVYFAYTEELVFIKADTIVLAVGAESEKELARSLKEAVSDIPVYEIGDCVEPRNIMFAVNEAAEVAHKI